VRDIANEAKEYKNSFTIEKNVIFAGFSQGAMLTLDLALHMKETPLGLALLSTGIICKNDWQKKDK